MTEETGLLIPLELYESVNIGTKQKSDMSRFIDTVNPMVFSLSI